jgi:superfamily II DNA or RNA helicase
LKYESTVWKKSDFGGRHPQIVTSHLITGRQGTAGTFLTGLLPRIKKALGNKIEIIGREEKINPTEKPRLPGEIFRPDQRKAFRAIRRYQRGKILMPTGSGKTFIALGIVSMFPQCRILFLCHTETLIEQTKEEFEKYFETKIYVMGGGYKTSWSKIHNLKKVFVLSTIQSFAKIPAEKYIDFFDITIIDETHHLNDLKSQYGKVMVSNLSPRRYGLTATEPIKQQEILINEGLLGPTIAELTIQEGIEAGIIAKPVINLIPVPYQQQIKIQCKNKYEDFYRYGIMENRARNFLIIKEVRKSLKKKETVLIIIERTDHGHILQKMLKYYNISVKFVHGATDKIKRLRVKGDLKSGKLRVAICSRIWKEGISIKRLNNIINACGYKEEKGVIQSIGRGSRVTKTKKTVTLTDFLDPYPYLAEHAILRIQIYVREGWM